MTLAISHHEDGCAVLDCVREVAAPFQPEAVVADFCRTLASYGIGTVVGDRYGGEWPREQFSKRDVTYRPSERVKSDIYRDCLPLLNSRKCQLLDIRRRSPSFTGWNAGRRGAARIRSTTVPVSMMTLRIRFLAR